MSQTTLTTSQRSFRAALILALLFLPAYLIACSGSDTAEAQAGADVRVIADKTPGGSSETHDMGGDMPKKDSEWKEILTPEQFRVTRQCGTEPAFTGKYYKHKGNGTYLCVCCGNELFSSDTKYESGSGWPSFWLPKDSANILEEADTSLGMARTEVKCSKCGAHLGHVFEDGPQPSGLRYCVNSAALNFVGAEEGDKQKQDE